MNSIPKIISAKPLDNFYLEIIFNDSEKKKIDIKPFIKNGVSSALKNENYFKTVSVENGYICWDNGFDFCPEFLKNYV